MTRSRSRRVSTAGLLLLLFVAAAPGARAYYPKWIQNEVFQTVHVGLRVHVADFDGDGRPDVVVQSQYYAQLLLTTPDGKPAPPVLIYTGRVSDSALADVDGDGATDVIIADSAAMAIVTLLSNGNGTFTRVTTAIPFVPLEIGPGRFEANQTPGLAVRGGTPEVLALFGGNGAGGFAEVWRSTLAAPAERMASGDLDGDGTTDVVLAHGEPATYAIYFGTGGGALAAPISVPGPVVSPARIVLADLDADGDAEIISCSHASLNVTVVVNDGSRMFAPPVEYRAVPDAYYWNLTDFVVADVTDDGHPDLVAVHPSWRWLVTLPGAGDGTLREPVWTRVEKAVWWDSVPSPRYLAAGDFDLDGRVDLAVYAKGGAAENSVVLLFRNASGDSSARIYVETPVIAAGADSKVRALAFSAVANESYPPPATGELRIMRGETLVGVTSNGELTISSLPAGDHWLTAEYPGDENFRPAVSQPVLQKVVAEPTSVVLTATPANTEMPYGTEVTLEAALTSGIPGEISGDLRYYVNGEAVYPKPVGTRHIVYPAPGSWEYRVEYLGSSTHPPGSSNVILQVVTRAQTVTTIENVPSEIPYGWYGPGEAEVRPRSWSNPVRVHANGSLLAEGWSPLRLDFSRLPIGTYVLRASSAGNDYYHPSESEPFALRVLRRPDQVTGDFSGDAKPDLLWRNYATGEVGVWHLDGTRFTGVASLTTVRDTNWRIETVGDLNGDGMSDLIWRNYSTGDVNVWYMNVWYMTGATYIGGANLYRVPDLNWRIETAGDFDGDGRDDLIWRNYATGAVNVWFLDGGRYVSGASLYSVPDPNWKIEGSGDFNGDGKRDLLWRNYSTGAVNVWFLDGTRYVSGASLYSVPDPQWKIEAIGDYDGDGKLDLIWRHYGTGSVNAWFLDGTRYVSGAALYSVPDPNWKIAGPR
jgi:hypothetical protein